GIVRENSNAAAAPWRGNSRKTAATRLGGALASEIMPVPAPPGGAETNRGTFMPGALNWLTRLRPRAYGRKPSLVLVNGLAEQPESWYRNHRYWRRYFDVFMPNVLVYDGEAIHQRLRGKQRISVAYLVD